VVNTSCVDSSVVFIDPISFSMLKKIQLRYSDFETPKVIKQSIATLRKLFDDIKKKTGKDPDFIFKECLDKESEEIVIKQFVEKLYQLDQSLTKADLFRTCHFLDEDASGTISLDEFIVLFGAEHENLDGIADQDSQLQDEIWPSWVVKEKKLPELETLLSKIFK
jgi:hypothetical protein